MKKPVHLLTGLSLAIILATQSLEARQSDAEVEGLLRPDSFQYSGMTRLFRQGPLVTPQLVALLNNSDSSVGDNAQLMLRIIGDAHGIQALHDWYEQPKTVLRMVNGAVPTLLMDWDYRHIETAILSHPYREWKTEAVNYLLALVVDGSPRADQMLKKMLDEVPVENNGLTIVSELANRIRRNAPRTKPCASEAIEEGVLEQAFFLTPAEKKRTQVKTLAYDDQHQRALMTVSQTFGNTFLVVLSRTDSCWGYRSISVYSTNN